MARVYDSFRPLLSFGAELASAIARGQVATTPQAVQRQVLALLEQARQMARKASVPPEWIESASFAMVSWIDETVAQHPPWQQATPLQAQLFNSTNAPSEFFHHLAALQPEEGELREIYWLALVFGFKGQYHFEQGDDGELGKLKDLHAQQLPDIPLTLGRLPEDRITPQPYRQPDPHGPRIPERRERALLRTGMAVSLLVPLLFWLWLQLEAARGLPERSPTLGPRSEPALRAWSDAGTSAFPPTSAHGDGWAQAQ